MRIKIIEFICKLLLLEIYYMETSTFTDHQNNKRYLAVRVL